MENKEQLFFSYNREEISINTFGGKAYWLNWLYNNGFTIPKSYFLKTNNIQNITNSFQENFINQITNLFPVNTKIAIRSSGISEDGNAESKAGLYETKLNVPFESEIVFENYKNVIESGNKEIEEMGVVIQEMITPAYSGVMFTSNPLNYSKNECIINYVSGLGENLVSGKTDSTQIKINKIVPYSITDEIIPFSKLLTIGKKLEELCNKPMDVEWCLEETTGDLYILQCRPITNIFHNNEIKKVCLDNMKNDNKIKYIDKIEMRLNAEKLGITVSPAFIINCNCNQEEFPFTNNDFLIPRSNYCRGYNIVVILPDLTDKKIIRSFVGKKEDALKYITCNRYGIRAIPKHDNLYDTAKEFYKMVYNSTWICTMIIQEIYDPLYTGILKQGKDALFLEIARGHFVAKGIVPMSTYTLSEDYIIKQSHEIIQDKYIRILEGYRIEFSDSQKISLKQDDIINTAKTFSSLMNWKNMNIEFGILDDFGRMIPYLIDYTEEEAKEKLSESDVESGIISNGKIIGKLVKINSENFKNTMDIHFKDTIETIYSDDEEPIIYYCELPDISLNSKLSRKNIGFVFSTGSLLCHLAVLLREKGIPSIIGVDENLLQEGAIYNLDTSAKGNWQDKLICK